MEAPDVFLHLSRSDLVMFKGDLAASRLTQTAPRPPGYVAIGPMAGIAGVPQVCY